MESDQQKNRQKEGHKTEDCLGLNIQQLSIEHGANTQNYDLSSPGNT